jgi:hypothetical protein
MLFFRAFASLVISVNVYPLFAIRGEKGFMLLFQ